MVVTIVSWLYKEVISELNGLELTDETGCIYETGPVKNSTLELLDFSASRAIMILRLWQAFSFFNKHSYRDPAYVF
jgi:hypothetical protein